jgi:hypothetical protein
VPYFKTYDSSDVAKALATVNSNAEARRKTVEADIKRIKPKPASTGRKRSKG